MNIPVSAVIITFNEAENIVRCLQSLQNVVAEIIVLDANSEDNTVELARQCGAYVFQEKWIGYAQNKNIANAKARYDWIFSIDADEVLTEELAKSLKNWQPQHDRVYAVNRLTGLAGQWVYHSGWHPDWKVRLFNRQKVHWQGDFVHETLHIPADFGVQKLHGLLHHYSYKNDADHWQRIEKYAALSAQELYKKGKKTNLIQLSISPIARFIRTYFIKKGILDGRIGWKISCRNAYLVYRKYRILQRLTKNDIRK